MRSGKRKRRDDYTCEINSSHSHLKWAENNWSDTQSNVSTKLYSLVHVVHLNTTYMWCISTQTLRHIWIFSIWSYVEGINGIREEGERNEGLWSDYQFVWLNRNEKKYKSSEENSQKRPSKVSLCITFFVQIPINCPDINLQSIAERWITNIVKADWNKRIFTQSDLIISLQKLQKPKSSSGYEKSDSVWWFSTIFTPNFVHLFFFHKVQNFSIQKIIFFVGLQHQWWVFVFEAVIESYKINE